MSAISLNAVEELDDEERRALRASRFGGADLEPLKTQGPKTRRLAHPGGPVVTNKAAALARFLKRKLQDADGFAALDPELVERAVKAAKTGRTTEMPTERQPPEHNTKDEDGTTSSEEDSELKKERKSTKHMKQKKSKFLRLSRDSESSWKSSRTKGSSGFKKKKKRQKARSSND